MEYILYTIIPELLIPAALILLWKILEKWLGGDE